MRIFIQGNEEQKSELASSLSGHSDIKFSDSTPLAEDYSLFDAFLILDKNSEEINFEVFEGKPVFINEIIKTLSELGTSENINRINAWPGFLKRDTWEVAGSTKPIILAVLKELDKKAIIVKDSPGMVAARVISMIINEAFYALKENVSTKEEIDLAMKLGTNYPYGPFEWSEKIGLSRIYLLLLKLSQTDERCIPAFEEESYI